MLRIPSLGERLPPLVVPIRGASPDEEAKTDSAAKGSKRRRKRKGRSSDGHAWDSEGGKAGQGEPRPMLGMLVGGAVLFTLIVAVVVVSMREGEGPVSATPPPFLEVPETAAPSVAVKSDSAILAEAEPLVRNFLTATRVEDMLPLVRNPAVAEERMRRQYPDGKIEAPGLNAFNTGSALSHLGKFMAVRVRTNDYDERSISFLDTPEGIRIDWESWVGWSEMPWEEFLTSKPTNGKLFRLKLSAVEYFNFSFSDDVKWHSYRLESPDGKHSVYGYAESGTVLDSRLRPSPDVKEVALTLSLKFPENATVANQVLIEKFIAEGWALETGATP